MSSHQCCMVNALHDVVYNIGVSGGDDWLVYSFFNLSSKSR